jgi:hypothetical protein
MDLRNGSSLSKPVVYHIEYDNKGGADTKELEEIIKKTRLNAGIPFDLVDSFKKLSPNADGKYEFTTTKSPSQ